MTTDLANRLVDHPRWKWALGMMTATQERIVAAERTASGPIYYAGLSRRRLNIYDTPNLDDEETVGILLDRLCAWCARNVDSSGGYVVAVRGRLVAVNGWAYSGETLGEAVAEALLVAWGKP